MGVRGAIKDRLGKKPEGFEEKKRKWKEILGKKEEKKEKKVKIEKKEKKVKKEKKGKGKEKKKENKSILDSNSQGIEPSRENDEEETVQKQSFSASEVVADKLGSLVIDEARAEDLPDDFEKMVAEEDAVEEDYVFA